MYLAARKMTNNENNLGMAGDDGLKESPLPEDGGGGANPAEGVETQDVTEELQDEPLSPEEIAQLKEKAAKADENWDKYLRIFADFENYKKRAIRERSDAVKYANEALVEKLLPVVDNFEAAIAATNAPNATMDSVKTGVNMIYTQLKSFLSDAGVEEIVATGKPFDPNFHEAVSQQPSEEMPEGHVLQQMRKGYKLRDRLIRAAMVVVSKKP